MENQSNKLYIDHNSWLDCIGQNIIKQKQQNNEHQQQNIEDQANFKQFKLMTDQQHQLFELMSLQDVVDKQLFKRSHSQLLLQQQFFTSNSSQCEMRRGYQNENELEGQKKSGYRKEKYAKQVIYSKNYRDKKKQQFKILQQQNQYLKGKIEELQIRLREKQLQINRLKHHSLQKQLTIQQLNNQFLTKVTLFVEKVEKDANASQGDALTISKQNRFYQQIFKTYDEHGFLGSRKKLILNYYFDEILEVLLRDSERYLCMLCCKNKDSKLEKKMPEYEKINHAFFQIMQMSEEKQGRVKDYIDFLFPAMREIRKNCTDFYRSYKKILQSMNKVHVFMRSAYPFNMDFARKRMQVQSWFEYHKYNKIMRKLKSEWLQFIKHEKENTEDEKKKKTKGSKKKKTTSMEEQQ